MMNYIWAAMLLIGILFYTINGNLETFNECLISSCSDAVYFSIGLIGIMATWSGIMNIAEKSGLIKVISNCMKPINKLLFPDVKSEITLSMILLSFITNIFGAGNSATVFSLKAMECLDKENSYQKYASNSMCMFTSLSMSMIQLVPITVIKIRADFNSSSPEDIILPSILAGIFSMIISVFLCKYFERN